jgi:serine/threonine protein kinase/tetratricopeptide (TPR) repeat protein
MAVDCARAKALFLAASDLADPAERAAYLGRECGGDADLRARVEALLRANDAAPLPEPGVTDRTGTLAPEGPATATFAAAASTADYPDKDERAGAVIAGKYVLVEVIGEGGMGSVWRARQTEPVKRTVAVKLIKAGMDSRAVLARFEAERQALALMDHPNIATVLDGGIHDGRPYFVMELVKGVPITEYCDAHRLTPRERLGLFVPVCQAIQHAHQKGVIHRDVKPRNVLVALYDDRPVVKVIDFGVAKATGGALTGRTIDTGFGGVVGTPEYMSPEQATFNNPDIDTRSDVYALGVLLYELLTGSPPFSKKDLEEKGLLEILRVVREEEPPRPSTKLSTAGALPTLSANRGTEPKRLTSLLRYELDWIVMKALEKDRGRRYETANGFAADVLRYLGGEPVLAHPPSTTYRLKKFVRRNRPQVVAAGLVFVALVAGVVGTALGLVVANRAAEAERLAKDDAVEQKRLAEQAAGQERQAKDVADARRREAERNLAFAKKGNEILGSVFAGLDPKRIAESGRPLQDVLREKLTQAVAELEGSSVGDPLEVAAMQNTLGASLLGLGEAGLAAEVLRKALDTRTARLGPDHPDTLQSTNNLALAYQNSGQPAKAVPLLVETLEKLKARFGPDDPRTLIAMGNLATAYQHDGQFARAVPLYEEVLEKRKAILPPDHAHTLLSMNTLAMAFQNIGQTARAVPLLEKAMDRQTITLGPDHPDTLTSMGNLATVYVSRGQLDRAVPLHEKVLERAKTTLGPDHPLTLQAMNNLAAAYLEGGQPARAVPLLEGALEKRKARLGPDHPDTLQSMNGLALAYQNSGQPAKALPLYEEALRKQKAKPGPDHPDTLQTMNNLAGAYLAGGQAARAVPLLEEALEKLKGRLGADHPRTLTSTGNLGRVYVEAGQGAKAAATLAAFVDGTRKRSPKDSPQFAGLLAHVSLDLLGCGQPAAAEPLLRECLAVREKTQPEAWTTSNTRSMLGGALLGQQKYADAEPLLLAGYDGLKEREKTIPPQGRARLPEAVDRLVELYAAWGKPAEAARWRAERAKYPPDRAPPPRPVGGG